MLAWQTRWPVKVLQLGKTRGVHQRLPGFQAVIGRVTVAGPAFLIVTPWIGAEQHAAWLETLMLLPQRSGQFAAGDMKERGIGKNAIKALRRQIQCQKVL